MGISGGKPPFLTCTFLTSSRSFRECVISRANKRFGAPGRARTCDLLIRSQTLYPTELRVHEGDGKREEQILQWRRKELLVIFHPSFSIFHLRPYLSDVGKKWKMENEKSRTQLGSATNGPCDTRLFVFGFKSFKIY